MFTNSIGSMDNDISFPDYDFESILQPINPSLEQNVLDNSIAIDDKEMQVMNNEVTTSQICCLICGDEATGKHYGAVSCDGCKGFFRRSVRKNHAYTCRFTQNCIVDKQKRNQCRYCRMQKCSNAGMKKASVQNERDQIKPKKRTRKENSTDNIIPIACIRNAEIYSTKNRKTIEANFDLSTIQIASIAEIYQSMKQHMQYLREWIRAIPAFSELPEEDQTALLKAHEGEHFLLELAHCSMHLEDVLLLSNNRCFPKYSEDNGVPKYSDISLIGERIMNEFIRPLANVNIDDMEFAYLKALLFFDPNVNGLSDGGNRVKCLRNVIQNHLEDHTSDRLYESRGRHGELLLSLGIIMSISREMMPMFLAAQLAEESKSIEIWNLGGFLQLMQ